MNKSLLLKAKSKQIFLKLEAMNEHKNLLLCGYLRKIQTFHKVFVPDDIIYHIDLFLPHHTIYGVGLNDYGAFGTTNTFKEFKELSVIQDIAASHKDIYYNYDSIMIINSQNNLYVAGSNLHSRLGILEKAE